MQKLRELSDKNFEAEVLQSPLPTLVDFWAPWCGPCRAVGPVLEQLAAERAKSVKLAKLNVDESPDVAAAYGVHSIPTLIIFKGNKSSIASWKCSRRRSCNVLWIGSQLDHGRLAGHASVTRWLCAPEKHFTQRITQRITAAKAGPQTVGGFNDAA